MSYSSFFQKSPFTYSKKNADSKHVRLNVLEPSLDDEAILKDVHRDMQKVFINGTSLYELRKRDLLTQTQRDLYNMNKKEINEMDLNSIKSMISTCHAETTKAITDEKKQETLTEKTNQIIAAKTEEEARKSLTAYVEAYKDEINKFIGFWPDNGHTLQEYKDFLKKHLLSQCNDEEEKEFLAETYVRGSHQSGFPKAAEVYFLTKYKPLIEAEEEKTSGKRVCNLEQPIRKVNLTYDSTKGISVLSKLKYRKVILRENEDTRVVEAPKNSYLAQVSSKIYIGTKKESVIKKDKTAIFNVKLQGDPLLIDIRKDDSSKEINQFLAKLFDPRNFLEKFLEYISKIMFNPKQKITEQAKAKIVEPSSSPRPGK